MFNPRLTSKLPERADFLKTLLPSVAEVISFDSTRRLSPASNSSSLNANLPVRVKRAVSEYQLHYPIRLSVTRESRTVPSVDDSESYRLKVGDSGVGIAAESELGALAACSTLFRLNQQGFLPHCELADKPCYGWRGLMIDTCRHFIELSQLRETLDLMACYRLNVLHLGLSNDQACRFHSNSAPRLASEPHYSLSELSELVHYAADRGIRIVPELDVPGHTSSWVWSYPEWGAGNLDKPATEFGVHQACLDPTQPSVVSAIKRVFEDLVEVFPDAYVHIGGDEVNPTWWNNNKQIQEWMRIHKMETAHQLQSWFIADLAAHLQTLGKRVVGWDEVLDHSLPSNLAIQAWRGTQARDLAVQAGHETIVSSPYYLDLFLPANFHYSFDLAGTAEEWDEAVERAVEDPRLNHVADGLRWQQHFGEFPSTPTHPGGRVLGGEACMWSELVDTDTLHRRVWSRLPVIAERFWRGADGLPEEETYHRLEAGLRQCETHFGLSLLNYQHDGLPAELAPLIAQLEPTKWYSRIIGEARTHARATGQPEAHLPRPYDVTTPLNRVVDHIPPESLEARRFVAALNTDSNVQDWTRQWHSQWDKFRGFVEDQPDLCELSRLSENLDHLAAIVDGDARVDMDLTKPVGEYLLPVARPVLDFAINRIAANWDTSGQVREIPSGHINDTFVIDEKLVLQRINAEIFDVGAVVRNRRTLNALIEKEIPEQLPTKYGKDSVQTASGETWRAAPYIKSRNFDVLPTELCEEAGQAFGAFLTNLRASEYQPDPVIDGFHDLDSYLKAFDDVSRLTDDKELLAFVNAQRTHVPTFDHTRFQVIHGDCKVNNLLFHPDKPNVLKIVDLDTLMWGHPAWDFGDLIRSVLTGTSMDSSDRERVERVMNGFARSFQISRAEIDSYARAPGHMSFMLGVRFLTDHLLGDQYFKVSVRGENRTRAAEQFALTKHLRELNPFLTNKLTKVASN